MLTFRQIEVFTAVMRAGSLIGAARDLRISQPTVTRMILRIEDQLGMTLFDRVKGRILPTPEATRFLAEVDRAFEQMRGAIDRAALASAPAVRCSGLAPRQAWGAGLRRPVWRSWPRPIRACRSGLMFSPSRRSCAIWWISRAMRR